MNAGYIFTFLFVKDVLSTKCKGCMDTLITKCSFLRYSAHYRKLYVASQKNLLQTVFENHPPISLNFTLALFFKLLRLIE
ncbi:hypothetical protein Lepto1489_22155 (plasmid) [Leptospira interrogans serovar Bataviae]|uniref:Uncharacterized protein n=1 Tax=Leptospira interrogans serovar Bataviae TaxID=312175 RepID=A0AAP9WNZ0_LEPIR|nr:hypothetical protein Lepto1489_22155 [Leptospira interrogans serovar Bataviae]